MTKRLTICALLALPISADKTADERDKLNAAWTCGMAAGAIHVFQGERNTLAIAVAKKWYEELGCHEMQKSIDAEDPLRGERGQ